MKHLPHPAMERFVMRPSLSRRQRQQHDTFFSPINHREARQRSVSNDLPVNLRSQLRNLSFKYGLHSQLFELGGPPHQIADLKIRSG